MIIFMIKGPLSRLTSHILVILDGNDGLAWNPEPELEPQHLSFHFALYEMKRRLLVIHHVKLTTTDNRCDTSYSLTSPKYWSSSD